MILFCFSVPNKPNNVTVVGQSTSHLEINWTQTGIITSYFILVLNEIDDNYTVTWYNETINGSYSATIADLTVSGRLYYINVTAISEGQYSEIATLSAATSKIIA